MQIPTKTFFKLIDQGDREVAYAADRAISGVERAVVQWGNLSSAECKIIAGQLRDFADLIDGEKS